MLWRVENLWIWSLPIIAILLWQRWKGRERPVPLALAPDDEPDLASEWRKDAAKAVADESRRRRAASHGHVWDRDRRCQGCGLSQIGYMDSGHKMDPSFDLRPWCPCPEGTFRLAEGP